MDMAAPPVVADLQTEVEVEAGDSGRRLLDEDLTVAGNAFMIKLPP
jgi:hypothetical protein